MTFDREAVLRSLERNNDLDNWHEVCNWIRDMVVIEPKIMR